MKCSLFVILIFICVVPAIAQKQLVLVKREKVLLRLHPGDEITFKVRGSKSRTVSYINNLFDTALVAHRNVVPLHKIDRLYFSQGNFMNVVGGFFVIAGAGYLIIDQINLVLVNKQSFQLDETVGVPSAVLVGVGLPMMLLKKKSQKIGGRYRLMVVEKGSAFFRPQYP